MGRYPGRRRRRPSATYGHAAIAMMAGSVVLSTGLVAGTGIAGAAPSAARGPASATVAIAGSYLGAPDATELGSYQSSAMGVEVVLQPRQAATMNSELAALYDPSSPTLSPVAPDRVVHFAVSPPPRRRGDRSGVSCDGPD